MPITRRKRTTPPEQPENNTNHNAEATENTGENPVVAQQASNEEAKQDAQQLATTEQPERIARPSTSVEPQAATHVPPSSFPTATNGERAERQDHNPSIESGRRTARGEFFRRPPQGPPAQIVNAAPIPPAPPQPSHEITLPLGNLLHLAYNPGYTGSDDARSRLLQQLAQESKEGGRARCWNCGSLAIKYDRWNTRSKTFGEVGVAFCEVCGVWSVM